MTTLRRLDGGNDPRRLTFVAALIGLVLLSGIASSCFTVDADEQAVVTRLGAYTRTVDSGLHSKMPFGIERATVVKVDRVMRQEFGYRSVGFEGRTTYSDEDLSRESLMLTGDLNQAEVEWSVQYRVKDARNYLFSVRDPESALKALSESATRAVIGDRSITEVLTLGKTEVEFEARRMLQEALDSYQSGIEVQEVFLQSVVPPDPVKPAFNQVNDAEQERETLINEARRGYEQAIPAARGEAERVVAAAEGYKIDRINRARGEAERFRSLLTEYQKNKEVTRKRLYFEAMAELMPKAQRKIVLDDTTPSILPLLDLEGGKAGLR